jgi:hypothetical protein
MVAEFVAKRAEKCFKGGDLFLKGGTHPDPDYHTGRIVVTEEFARAVFADSQRSGCKHTDTAVRDL